jgi:glyoxylate reductase
MTKTARTVCLLSLTPLPDRVLQVFRERFDVVEGQLSDAGDLRPDALLCSIADGRFNEIMINRLPDSVKAIGTYSVGYDHFDAATMRKRGIALFNTPGVLGNAVADAAMLLILVDKV